ncbi:glycosyltransferase [Janibacter sp. HTCC2649]|uniref:glycosyltransferase n=1 Tax=Janibacter sp. HTCC2649 TaxID=313589 RepID=UPI0011D226D6|nr:hypothetical protein [Janibacter sp. HTCC2649]
MTIGGRVGVDSIVRDIDKLRERGRAVALIAHGSDVRSPDLHMDLSASSYFHNAPNDWVEAARQRSATNRSIATTSGLPLFVSTPDLINDLPMAKWLPLTIDLEASPFIPRAWNRRPRVLHLPSRSFPPIKGTELIEQVLADLSRQGILEWVRKPTLRHTEFIKLLASVDIVVDQILGGSYGVTTVEAMASGCVVVGNVETLAARHMAEAPPVVQAGPGELAETLGWIAGEPNMLERHSELGRGFVKRWHEGKAASQVLEPFLV